MITLTGPFDREAAVPADGDTSIARSVLFVAVLLLIWIGLHPFPDLSSAAEAERPTDIVYHAVALALCGAILFVAAPILRGALPSLNRALTVALLLWFLVSVVTSQSPGLSARRLFVTLTDITLAMTVLLVPRGVEDFSKLLAIAASGVLLVCYLGVMVAPNLSIHHFGSAGEAAELDGNWRGLFAHKNTAGAMMAVFIIIGLFVAGTGRAIAGTTITFAAALFLLFTQSKNSIALLPATLAIAYGVQHAQSLWMRFAIGLGPLALLNLLTVGTVYSDAVKSLVAKLPIDPTFTGRTEIWGWVAGRIAEHPVFGHGIRAFWYTDQAVDTKDPANAWMADIVNSHNGYLDLMLTIGVPGFALMIIVFMVYPMMDYHRRQNDAADEPLAMLFLRIWLFEIYTSTFESFFFDRAFPGWFTTMMAVFGLRYMAKLRTTP